MNFPIPPYIMYYNITSLNDIKLMRRKYVRLEQRHSPGQVYIEKGGIKGDCSVLQRRDEKLLVNILRWRTHDNEALMRQVCHNCDSFMIINRFMDMETRQ